MKLYNTLSRTKEDLKPLKAGHISLYTCGPTVYQFYHIGNLRNAVFNDLLRRTLELQGLKVKQIMNITDVGHLTSDADAGDDKLQRRAAEEGKDVWQVAEFYTAAFKKDVQVLGVLPPAKYVKATETIEQQIDMVQTLLDKGFAYQAEQAVYFDVTKLKDYGKLTGQKLSEKEVGARDEVVTDPEKHHPQDFALWFFTVGRFAEHQMKWDSPWGEGFPGWHLECSAIIESELGETIDIHTGGVDHIGTHHTNEIAQSEAAHAKPLAKTWVHIEFLQVDGQKMSKSLSNTYTLDDVVAKGYDPMALRLLYLQSHYRSQQNFTWEALDAASNLLTNLRAWADRQFQVEKKVDSAKFKQEFEAALADDLNTPKAWVLINRLMYDEDRAPDEELLKYLDKALGLQLSGRKDITAPQKDLIKRREDARVNRDFQMADKQRENLREDGIEVDDTSRGPRWRRID